MKHFFLFVVCLVLLGTYQAVLAQCYLLVDNPGGLDSKAITQISIVQISQSYEPVNEIPIEGIGADACTYNLSISEISNGILVSIKGRKTSTYGDSKLRGFDGFRQALFRAIISDKPEQKDQICQRYYHLMSSDCIETPPPIQGDQTIGKLIVRVPHEYRFARIFSSGQVLGQMDGSTVKEFEVDLNSSMTLTARDGAFESEDIYATALPNNPARAEFIDFRSSGKSSIPQSFNAEKANSFDGKREDFGADNPFIIGFSFVVQSFVSTDKDEARRGGLGYEEVTLGGGFDLFFEYFPSENLGLGFKTNSIVFSRTNTLDTSYKQDFTMVYYHFIGDFWFPLSTKDHGYSHFGLTGGIGPSIYKISVKQNDTETEVYEARGTSTSFGAFFDWGGDVFGARLGYNVINTNFDKLKRTDVQTSDEYDVDGSGSSVNVTIRWAF
ncbi:hypothetical protein KKA14_11770 [bacterium]|nr:hypothetical protein [bacterium]